MPLFTHSWQGSLQGNYTNNNKLYLEGSCSIPNNLILLASHTAWRKGLDYDEDLTSFGTGIFWPNKNEYSWSLLGGFGLGSQRIGPSYVFDGPWNGDRTLISEQADLRTFFVEFLGSKTEAMHFYHSTEEFGRSSTGYATRIEYVDRYHFSQLTRTWFQQQDSLLRSDTTTSINEIPNHSWNLDLVAFGSIGYSFFDLIGSVMFRFPIGGYRDYTNFLMFNAGVRLTF